MSYMQPTQQPLILENGTFAGDNLVAPPDKVILGKDILESSKISKQEYSGPSQTSMVELFCENNCERAPSVGLIWTAFYNVKLLLLWISAGKFRSFLTCNTLGKKCLPAKIYLFKVNDRNARKRFEICSKLTMKTPERRHWRHFVVSISNVSNVEFEQVNVNWDGNL